MQTHLKPKKVEFIETAFPGGHATIALVETETHKRAGIAVIQSKDMKALKYRQNVGRTIAQGRATMRKLGTGTYDLDSFKFGSPKKFFDEIRRQELRNYGKTVKYRALLEISKVM